MTKQDRRSVITAGVLIQRLQRSVGTQCFTHTVAASPRLDDLRTERRFCERCFQAGSGRGRILASTIHTTQGGNRLLRGYAQ